MNLKIIFFVLTFLSIAYPYREKYHRFIPLIVLGLISPFVGLPLSWMLIKTTRLDPPNLGEPGIEGCPHCGTPYRPVDYREDVTIRCSECHQVIRGPQLANA